MALTESMAISRCITEYSGVLNIPATKTADKRRGKMRELTTDDLIELICDVAYQQATREFSGIGWFREFIAKVEEKQKGVTL